MRIEETKKETQEKMETYKEIEVREIQPDI